ncbi:MAG TPA: alpha/beta fold hydrolase [Microcella sp.]|nr:alpha/beta fold hydrolase [Microcella sp.]
MTHENSTTPFTDLESFIALPRIDAVALSPDGERAILTFATLAADRTSYERALWEVPTRADGGAPRRLTRSAKGETGVAFTPSGDVLFVSARPDAEAGSDADEAGQLWLLPAGGGEARPVTRVAGGVSGVAATALKSDRIVIAADLLPGADTLEDEAAARAERKKRKVAAILHESYPVRFWDHDLGPAEPHLLALELSELADQLPERPAPGAAAGGQASADAGGTDGEASGDGDAGAASAPYAPELPRPRDLTPHPGRSADTAGQALTPDGATLIVARQVATRGLGRHELVAIDVATGDTRVLFSEEHVGFHGPVLSRDGRTLAYTRAPHSTPAGPADRELWVSDVDGGNARRIAEGWDRWASEYAFAPDGASLYAIADDNGRAPILRIPLDGGGDVARVTNDDYAYSGLQVDARGEKLVALRSNWLEPPHPVSVDVASGAVTALPSPAALPATVGELVEVETTAEDGARVRGWLLTPEGASADSPAPLLLWIHGGPLNSWNAWSWRWAPQLAVARGYAVLLPDPALSTGYGLDFIARGWNAWGKAPFTDLMSITDAVVARDEIDETRTAALGGSFGGYMANWVAGHTDRFDAIVTHASLWALDQFGGTTDNSAYWLSIFDEQGLAENSPHHSLEKISTPMLVIHGDRDYRVPIGESLRLWSELAATFSDEEGKLPHKFLYYPDENHWILKPQHAIVWYETVFAFLAENVLGKGWERPKNLG